jgi:hypothetical protein
MQISDLNPHITRLICRMRRKWRCEWVHHGILYVEAPLDVSWDGGATRLRVRRLFQVVRCVEHGRCGCGQFHDGELHVKAPLDELSQVLVRGAARVRRFSKPADASNMGDVNRSVKVHWVSRHLCMSLHDVLGQGASRVRRGFQAVRCVELGLANRSVVVYCIARHL